MCSSYISSSSVFFNPIETPGNVDPKVSGSYTPFEFLFKRTICVSVVPNAFNKSIPNALFNCFAVLTLYGAPIEIKVLRFFLNAIFNSGNCLKNSFSILNNAGPPVIWPGSICSKRYLATSGLWRNQSVVSMHNGFPVQSALIKLRIPMVWVNSGVKAALPQQLRSNNPACCHDWQ